jgi:hypothetical protein
MADFDSKFYEALALEHEKLAKYIKDGTKIVEEFVKNKKRIIVGGMAIDMLLRAHGDQIYPDELLDFPDIDIMTPDCIADAQDLADILYDNDFPNVSAISAIHILTRKCRVDGRVLCDATYVPPHIYEKIPYMDLENGFRVIHPFYQKMDQYMLMSKFYTETPRESAFNRLKKDITRYNMLNQFYKIEPTPEKLKMYKVRISAEFYPEFKELKISSVIHGYAAYAALITIAKTMLADKWQEIKKDPEVIIADAFFDESSGDFVYESPCEEKHLLIDAPEDGSKPKNAEDYEALMDLIPDKWILKSSRIELWRFTGTLISVGTGTISGKIITIPSAQYVLMFLLTMFFFGNEKNKNINLLLHNSLIKLLNYLEPLYDPPKTDNTPFFIPTATIGKVNMSQSQMIILMKIRKNLGLPENALLCIPGNYWPATSKRVNNFDYDTCEFFCRGGRLKI